MKLCTINPHTNEINQEGVEELIKKGINYKNALKFVVAESEEDLITILTLICNTHATIARTVSDNMEIIGGGKIKFSKKGDTIKYVEFSSESIRDAYGHDRPAEQEKETAILTEIRSLVEATLRRITEA
ncbi:hypothetical protein ACFL2V_09425 [Pseudomonadota bacterium]